MKFQERSALILAELAQKPSVSAEELSRKLQVSLVTIRKDLNQMDRDGLLIRTFGGATACSVSKAQQTRMAALQIIARGVSDCIEDGDSLILDAGSTTLLAARWLLQKEQLKVITNSLPIGLELCRHEEIQLILLGGDLNSSGVFTYGKDAVRQLEQYKARKLILSVSGVSCSSGLTTRHSGLPELFRKMIERSHEVIVVADDTKIGFERFSHICDLDAVDRIITNWSPDSEPELQRMEARGIQVTRCREEG